MAEEAEGSCALHGSEPTFGKLAQPLHMQYMHGRPPERPARCAFAKEIRVNVAYMGKPDACPKKVAVHPACVGWGMRSAAKVG
jgi:hypothetical protein